MPSSDESPSSPIRALGEIALRVENLDRMQRFYQEVIRLPLLRRFDHAVFFRIADGYRGHTQVLALFDRSAEIGYHVPKAATSTVDHVAFAIGREDFDSERDRLSALGLSVETTEHAWVQWRSLYVRDPEGNQVELVCHDPSIA
jgi:catechol 2,3-dioxygenase-like lactoylglutathione lyase family enzyme